MKNLIAFCLLTISFMLTSCGIFDQVITDECDHSNLGTNSISSNIVVSTIFRKGDISVPDVEVKIEFHKIACGMNEYKTGGDFTYTGKTNSEGMFNSGIVGYNLRNSNDLVLIDVFYKNPNGIWEQIEQNEYRYYFFNNNMDPRIIQYNYNL